ncbi:MAG: hypothetical protein ACR2HN_07995 [Tepidiformaceae bacterium]
MTQKPLAGATATAPGGPVGTILPSPTIQPGRLDRLKGTASSAGWVAASQAGFPISARIPPTYYAKFTVFNLLDGGQSYQIHITNFDPNAEPPSDEGAATPPGRVGLIASLYGSGPGIIAQSPGTRLDSVEAKLPGVAGGSLLVEHRKVRSFGGPEEEEIFAIGQIPVSGGRYLVVSASTSSPGNDDLVRELFGILSSLEVR